MARQKPRPFRSLFTTSAVTSATTHITGTWITTNQSVLNMPVQKL